MTTIDELGERAATAARADAAAMAARRVESGLEQLRLENGPTVVTPRRGIDPRRWLTLGIAAALTAAAIVALAVNANETADHRVVPGASTTQETTATTTATSTSVASTEAPSTTVAPAVVPADAIAVSHNALPPPYQATVFATIDAPADPTRLPYVAIGDSRIVAVDTDASMATLIDPFATDAAPEQLPINAALVAGTIVAGPGDVLYGVVQGTAPLASLVAIALSGDTAGQVIASAPISAVAFAEAPSGVLGHGVDGIIDRRTGATLLAYVDATGAPTSLGRQAHTVGTINGDVASGDFVIRDPDGKHDWHLVADRAATYSSPQEIGEALPAPSSHGGAVVWTSLGPPDDPNVDAPSDSVVAVLAADGSGAWYSLIAGWQVATSDLDGTILERRTGDKIELARLDPPQRIDFLNVPAKPHQRPFFAVTLATTLTTAPPCAPRDLDLSISGEGAMGTVYGSLLVRNKGDQPCEVSGVPEVAFLDDAGNVVQSTDPALLGGAGGTPVILEKDSWAVSVLGPIDSNVCGGNESSQFRLTLAGDQATIPFANSRPYDSTQCTPAGYQPPGPGALPAGAFDAVQPNSDLPDPFATMQVAIEAPSSVKAGDVLRYDIAVTATADFSGIASDTCPLYTETLATAAGQFLLNCNGGTSISISAGETVRFHIELAIPTGAALGPATLTWTPIEPAGAPVTATVAIVA